MGCGEPMRRGDPMGSKAPMRRETGSCQEYVPPPSFTTEVHYSAAPQSYLTAGTQRVALAAQGGIRNARRQSSQVANRSAEAARDAREAAPIEAMLAFKVRGV